MSLNTLFATAFNHERYETIAIVIASALLIWFYGCESQVPSLLNPSTHVTRAVFTIEVENFLKMAEHRYDQLDQQDQIKEALLTNALLFASTGTLNPVAVITTLAGILGIGATVDNVRKRKEIKTLKAPIP